MERIHWLTRTVLWASPIALGLALTLIPINSIGSVTFQSASEANREQTHSRFPESSFGKAPADPITKQHRPGSAFDGARRGPASVMDDAASGDIMEYKNPEDMRDENTFVRQERIQRIPHRGKGVQEVALIAGDLGFFPRTLFVNPDIPVRLFVTGASRHTLCIMIDAFNVRKQVRNQKVQEITFTPSTPGTYRYYCPVNGMEGLLVVRELQSPLPQVPAARSNAGLSKKK